MRRLNDECVPKGSHEKGISLSSLVDNYLANPMRASSGNSSRVVNSISKQPFSNLTPTTCHGKNNVKPGEENIVYSFVTRPGFSEEDLLKILPSGNCPVELDLNEVHQHGNGMPRRLQFENSLQNFTTGCSSLPYHPSNNINRSSSPANPDDPMVLKSSHPASISRCRSPAFSTVNKTVGFGLHLNSIFSSITSNSVATVSTKEADKDCYSLQPNNNVFVTSPPEPENTENSIPNIVKPISEYETSDQGKVSSESDMNQVNSQKKRKRADENDGCKRCNCKKTKCLKLYCDCFAAGVYCADSCACQGCFNTPVYEATVLETRQQIESRNPLAFAPKIVVQQQYSNSPAASNGDDSSFSTPVSARHKRGCNCKKSMCQKKYCECFQANVGCSDGCRCEGCKNVWGKKEDYGLTKDVVAEDTIIERPETPEDQQLVVIFHQDGFSHSLCDSTSLPPKSLHTGSEFGGNQYAIPPPPPSYEQFNTPVKKIRQSQFSITSSPLSALGNSNNLICPGNSGFSSTGSLRKWPSSSLTHLNQFSGMKVLRKYESDNTTEGDDTPDILKDNYNLLYNSEKVRSPNKKRVSPPHNARVTERGSFSVPAMRSARKFILQSVPSYPSLSPMNDQGRQQTFLTPLKSCIDRNKPEDNVTGK